MLNRNHQNWIFLRTGGNPKQNLFNRNILQTWLVKPPFSKISHFLSISMKTKFQFLNSWQPLNYLIIKSILNFNKFIKFLIYIYDTLYFPKIYFAIYLYLNIFNRWQYSDFFVCLSQPRVISTIPNWCK